MKVLFLELLGLTIFTLALPTTQTTEPSLRPFNHYKDPEKVKKLHNLYPGLTDP